MFAVTTGGEVLFYGACGLVLLFMLYMMAFRTDDFLRLQKAEEERKQKQAERLGKTVKGAAMLFKLFKR